jgi:hypothetical protein
MTPITMTRYKKCKLALLEITVKFFLIFHMCKTCGRIRIRIWIGIKMDSGIRNWIRIGIKTMPIHKTVRIYSTEHKQNVQSYCR